MKATACCGFNMLNAGKIATYPGELTSRSRQDGLGGIIQAQKQDEQHRVVEGTMLVQALQQPVDRLQRCWIGQLQR